MATHPSGNGPLIDALAKLIDLPKHLISLDLHMDVEEFTTVRCAFYPTLLPGSDSTSVERVYRLEEIEKNIVDPTR